MSKFVKGQSGNPAGRPVGARQKIVEPFYASLLKLWEADGDAILERLRISDPATLVRTMAAVMPKELALSFSHQPAGLDAEQWEQVTRIAAVIREIAPTATPGEIETVLRSGFAKQIGA